MYHLQMMSPVRDQEIAAEQVMQLLASEHRLLWYGTSAGCPEACFCLPVWTQLCLSLTQRLDGFILKPSPLLIGL